MRGGRGSPGSGRGSGQCVLPGAAASRRSPDAVRVGRGPGGSGTPPPGWTHPARASSRDPKKTVQWQNDGFQANSGLESRVGVVIPSQFYPEEATCLRCPSQWLCRPRPPAWSGTSVLRGFQSRPTLRARCSGKFQHKKSPREQLSLPLRVPRALPSVTRTQGGPPVRSLSSSLPQPSKAVTGLGPPFGPVGSLGGMPHAQDCPLLTPAVGTRPRQTRLSA